MKHRDCETNIAHSFLVIQGILYVIFLAFDITGRFARLSTSIKYIIIILCLLFTIYKWDNNHSWKRLCIRSAFLFTLFADYFLLLLDRHYFYGILLFIIVQQIYGIKLDLHLRTNLKCKQLVLKVMYRLGWQMMATVIISNLLNHIGIITERTIYASILYFISFVANIIRAISVARQQSMERSHYIFAFGMILFILCDINVAIYNLSDYLPLTFHMEKILHSFSSILMWAFYAPSQVLIALSIRDYR